MATRIYFAKGKVYYFLKSCLHLSGLLLPNPFPAISLNEPNHSRRRVRRAGLAFAFNEVRSLNMFGILTRLFCFFKRKFLDYKINFCSAGLKLANHFTRTGKEALV